MIKNFFFFCRMNIYLRKIICNTNIFCIKRYFSNEIYYIFTFSFIFFSVKKVFFSKKKNFSIKLFFPYKNIFSANNLYFVKNIFSTKKIFFFNLVLQQMNNHIWATASAYVMNLLLFLILESMSMIIALICCKYITIFSESVSDFLFVQIVPYCIGRKHLKKYFIRQC